MKTFNGGLFTDFDVMPLATPAAAVERRERHVGLSRQPVHRRIGSVAAARRSSGDVQRKHQGGR